MLLVLAKSKAQATRRDSPSGTEESYPCFEVVVIIAARMGAPPPVTPPVVSIAPTAPQPVNPAPQQAALSFSDAEAHYRSLLDYFKTLMAVSSSLLTLIIGVGVFFFWTNMRDVRQDAKEQAGRIATQESEKGVRAALDEKNMNELVQKVAREKVNAVATNIIEQKVRATSDKMMEEQLRPLQHRILVVGRISELQILIHRGDRPSLNELIKTMDETNDSDIRRFAESTLNSVRASYEAAYADERRLMSQPGVNPLGFVVTDSGVNRPGTLGDVVRFINEDSSVDNVAQNFVIFEKVTGDKNIKMFDFKAIKAWCDIHEPQCKLPPSPAPAPKK